MMEKKKCCFVIACFIFACFVSTAVDQSSSSRKVEGTLGNINAMPSSTSYITITNPTNSSNWITGNSYNITWTSSGSSGFICIGLWDNDSISTIAYNVSNSGFYYWTIPSNLTEYGVGGVGTCYIYINDLSIYNLWTRSAAFVITNPPSSSTPGFSVAFTLLGFLIGVMGIGAITLKKRH